MTDLNSVNITGRCVNQPDLTKKEDGLSALNFTLAVNRDLETNSSDEFEERVSFVDFTLLGSDAEKVHQWLKKETVVSVEGHIELENWETSEGKKASKLKIVPERVKSVTN